MLKTTLSGAELAPHSPPQTDLVFDDLSELSREYISQSKAANTLRAYRADWADFTGWCEGHGRVALPAEGETVALYLSDRARSHKTSTLCRRLTGISQAHQAAGYDSPTRGAVVRAVWQGIQRAHGTAPAQKTEARSAELRRMVEGLERAIKSHDRQARKLQLARDRALLLLGFFGAFRRSELVGLDRPDIDGGSAGLVVTLRRSKTDQVGAGREIGIPFQPDPEVCPVRAVKGWIKAAGVKEGALFLSVDRHGNLGGRLSGQAVALIVKRAAGAAGLDPAVYAGHSLRSGFATSAAEAGASERSIMEQTGHKSAAIVRRYIRRGNLFSKDSAAAAIRM